MQEANTNECVFFTVLTSEVEQEVVRVISGVRPRLRPNGKSRSMDSIVHLSGEDVT